MLLLYLQLEPKVRQTMTSQGTTSHTCHEGGGDALSGLEGSPGVGVGGDFHSKIS